VTTGKRHPTPPAVEPAAGAEARDEPGAFPVVGIGAQDGVALRPGCAYAMPPNEQLAVAGGRLVVEEPAAPRGRRLPIDGFFRSLAQDKREQAVGIAAVRPPLDAS
jgi:chemotaxis response regulator CheB